MISDKGAVLVLGGALNKQLGFIKDNFQFIYSLILLITIPIAIIGSNLWDIQNNQKILDQSLQEKATLSAAVVGSSVSDLSQNYSALQLKVSEIGRSNAALKEIDILIPQNEGFLVVATTNEDNKNLVFKSQDFTKAWVNPSENADPILMNDTSINPPERYYAILKPIKDTLGQKQFLLSLKMSLKSDDLQNNKNLTLSFIVLAITIFFVLLLLINHFRFFEYAVLFKRLKEVDKMKDDFISVASHELKTPMAAIKGYLSMIFEGVAGKVDQKAKDHLEKISANVQRLDVLINGVLDVSRLDQQRIQFDMQPVDISATVKQIINELQGQVDEKKLYIKYHELPAPKPMIFVDAERLGQVLDNLIGNAIKYTSKGGIEIFHQVKNGRLITFVKDTGFGIAPEDQKRIYEKFYRVQNKKTMDIPGTGLGLWITKELVQRMNGEISFTSSENVGSTFSINFTIIKD